MAPRIVGTTDISRLQFDRRVLCVRKEVEGEAKENSGKGGPLYFAVGVHPQHTPIAGYGWIKHGKDFPLKSNAGQRRLNINGAIDIRSMHAEVRMDGTINGTSTLALIK